MAKFKKKLSTIKSSKTGPRKVVVPNLSSLTRSSAQSLLTSLGLVYSESSITTSVSSEDNSISSQNISALSTVNIGSTINFAYKAYVAPYSNPPPYNNPYNNPPPYDNTYSNPPPYDNTYSNPPPPPYNNPPQDCSGYQYRFNEPICGGQGGYASIYNGCGQFLGCND